MTLPNFLIIGAGSSGTTSLYHYLKQHPDIFMSPIKEPRFFYLEGEQLNFRGPGDQQIIRSSVTNPEDYQKLFEGVTNETATGEASPIYLNSARASERIRHYLPEAKLIAILRNPVDRAYTNFLNKVQQGREPFTDFREALQEEEKRIRANWMNSWHYVQRGFYHTQLRRYFDRFPRDQIKIYLFEELVADPVNLLQDIFRFLGVKEDFIPDVSLKHNVSKTPKFRTLYAMLKKRNRFTATAGSLFGKERLRSLVTKVLRFNFCKPRVLPKEVRKQLIEVYREEILKLQDLINRDLSKWLE